MHICMLAGNPLAYDGRVLRHAEALADAGHRVTLLGVIGPNDPVTAPPKLRGVRVYRLDRRRKGVLPRLTWLVSAGRRRLARQVVKLAGPLAPYDSLLVAPCALELLAMAVIVSADIYHANDLDTLVPAAWAARLLQRPYIYDAHELYADESPELSPTERAARAKVESALVRGARATLTVSDLLADALSAAFGGARPIVVHNVPALVPRPPRKPVVAFNAERPLRLLLHGSWVGLEQPGVETALLAIRDLPQVVLTLRGGVRDEAALAARLRSLGIDKRVRRLPRLSGAEALVAAAIAEEQDIGLSVHLPDCESRRLATSSKVFEYLMAGLAVVATDLRGNQHIFDELCAPIEPHPVGLLYKPGDFVALRSRLELLRDEPPRLFAMQEAARRVAERSLSFAQERRRLLSLYA